jgi:hypothetical protein
MQNYFYARGAEARKLVLLTRTPFARNHFYRTNFFLTDFGF